MNFRPCPISNVRRAKWLRSGVRTLLSLVLSIPLAGQSPRSTDFEISFAANLRAEPVTGRMFVFIAKTNESEPRLQLYRGSAVFATNVTAQKPGVAAILDQS